MPRDIAHSDQAAFLTGTGPTPLIARAVLLLLVTAALAGGFLATPASAETEAIASAGPDLTRLLRAMAAIKSVLALGAVAAVVWRLGTPVSARRLAAYGLACGAMAAGPALIWHMQNVLCGTILLHGGLLTVPILFWRDPAVSQRLAVMIAQRRHAAHRG